MISFVKALNIMKWQHYKPIGLKYDTQVETIGSLMHAEFGLNQSNGVGVEDKYMFNGLFSGTTCVSWHRKG